MVWLYHNKTQKTYAQIKVTSTVECTCTYTNTLVLKTRRGHFSQPRGSFPPKDHVGLGFWSTFQLAKWFLQFCLPQADALGVGSPPHPAGSEPVVPQDGWGQPGLLLRLVPLLTHSQVTAERGCWAPEQLEIAWNGCGWGAAEIPSGLHEVPAAQYVSLYCGFLLLQSRFINDQEKCFLIVVAPRGHLMSFVPQGTCDREVGCRPKLLNTRAVLRLLAPLLQVKTFNASRSSSPPVPLTLSVKIPFEPYPLNWHGEAPGFSEQDTGLPVWEARPDLWLPLMQHELLVK